RIDAQVAFMGAIPFDEAMLCYKRAHFLVLPSRHSEGWPKVLAEAMCHGLVCVASDHGLIPWMLQDRGLVFPVDDAKALAANLVTLINDPARYRALSLSSAHWAQRYSLEGLRNALATLLTSRWKIAINGPRQHAPEPAVTPVP
ncbi:MAG: glycosyl transferase, partial [Bryobacterales bacterium]|nr:glycosyl transferase [Bryobacterales bacterium]